MAAQQKMFRVFKLIGLLTARPGKSVKQLAESLEINPRSVYRYFELLEELGFIVEKDFDDRYFIFNNEMQNTAAFNFTVEEASLLKRSLNALPENNPLQESIARKLFFNSELETHSVNLYNARLSQSIEKLSMAIKNERQVVLQNYHSANSNTISDRLVEPIDLIDDYKTVVAYDVKNKGNRHFKIERIEGVKILEKSHKHSKNHQVVETDMFGMSGKENKKIQLKLSQRAALLLKEEYPLSRPYVAENKDGYFFEGSVKSFKGIGRFVLGLIDEIEILRPKDLTEYLKEKITNTSF